MHFIAHIRIPFLFQDNNPLVCTYYILFIYSSINGHLHCFHFLATVNMFLWKCVCVCTCVEISLHVNESTKCEGLLYMLEWGILCLSKESIQTGQVMLRLWLWGLCVFLQLVESSAGVGGCPWVHGTTSIQQVSIQLQLRAAGEPVFCYYTNSQFLGHLTGVWDRKEA